MRINGLGEAHIAKLINHLNQIPKPDEPTLASFEGIDDYYNAQAIKWMIKKIHIEPRWTLLEGSNSIHAFVGPCGSGKTATICKIAAHYKREEKCKVLLISYDNSRLAAQEQLRVYAKVLGSPFVSINEASELEGVLLEHRECDLILIDTAGRYPKHDNQISDLKDLSKSNLPIDFHMVLSVTEKEEHSNRAIRGFSPIGLQSIIFSKLDESWTFGEIFNLSQKWSLPLSFFTTGQKVPDDIERACRERVIERIFGL
ncbi:MAG: DEAD/DEAH box helicase family protein [Bdellovibrionota bacterium]